MSNQQGQSSILRVALDSIPARWAAAALATHATLTTIGVVWSIVHHVLSGDHTSAHALYRAIGLDVIAAFGISTATVITIAEVIDTIMVISHFVGQKLKAEGRAQGLAEGRAEAEKEMHAQMAGWLDRLLAQHPELKDSVEPLPGTQTESAGNRDKPQEEH